LTSRENALLVNPHNPDALADCLIELVRDQNLRATLAKSVREMNFGDESWLSIARKTEQIYESVSSPFVRTAHE
jgi:glycosyltransferase involved in cell wall biosynthesis